MMSSDEVLMNGFVSVVVYKNRQLSRMKTFSIGGWWKSNLETRKPSSTRGRPKDKIFVMGAGPALPVRTGMVNSSRTAVGDISLPIAITVFDRN